jgi:hypothetical protein
VVSSEKLRCTKFFKVIKGSNKVQEVDTVNGAEIEQIKTKVYEHSVQERLRKLLEEAEWLERGPFGDNSSVRDLSQISNDLNQVCKVSEPLLTNLDVLTERSINPHRAGAFIEELRARHRDSRALVKGSAAKPAGHGHVDLLMASLARIERQRSCLIGQFCNRLVRAIDSQEKRHPSEGIATVHPQMERMIPLDTPELQRVLRNAQSSLRRNFESTRTICPLWERSSEAHT